MTIREIKIDTSILNRNVDDMAFLLNRIRNETNKMYEVIRQLDSMWDGPANSVFVQQFRNDYQNMQRIFQTVQSLLNCMENARQAYNSGENQVDAIVSLIRI